MTWQSMRKRALAAVLAAALSVTTALPALAAEPIGDGVAPTYDEAYYATLDYYGNLLEGSVVKSYALNGRDSLTDYGVYDEVVNLTDGAAPELAEGSATFRFPEGAPDHFYFEGKTGTPFEDLPWTITLRYTLNGVPARAEDLAGKQGVVEILLDLVPNGEAGDYARYNYTLAATALFNQDDILSLEAPGAQVQLVGNLRTVLFLCLPGEERHFTIRVGSDAFSFGGLTVLMMPATLAQLEEIAKLSQRKDDLEEDYRALSGSLDELLDALSDIQGGLTASAQGLDQLNAARGTFSGGKGALYEGTDRLRGDLSNLAELLAPVEQRIQALSRTVTDSKAVLNEMADATVTLQGQLAELEDALTGLEQGTADLKSVVRLAAGMENSLLRLESALGGVHVDAGSVATNSRGLVEKVKNVHGAYAAADTETFLQKLLEAQGAGSAEAKAKAAGMTALLAADKAGLPVPPDQQEALAAAKRLETLHQAKQQTDMGFQDFCGQVTQDPETAKQMNDLWMIYNSGGSAPRTRSDLTITLPGAGEPEEPAEEPEVPEDAGAVEEPEVPEEEEALSARMTFDEALEDGEDSPEESVPDAPEESTPETPDESAPDESTPGESVPDESTPGEGEAPGGPPENDTVGGAVVDLITGGLDSATARIDAIQSELSASLNRVKRPAASVAGDLANLCGELDLLLEDLDSAKDLTSALKKSSGTLRELLAEADALRTVLNEYEPTLQEALTNAEALSASAAATIRDTETLLADAERLARSTGVDLDAGTKQSLQGLSAALRQTAKALATTRQVKEAKNTVTGIIEDVWEEYTGDVNNLLLMDATAEAVSLTDRRNPAPGSVQVLIRTQEIKEEEAEEPEAAAAAKAKTTFWGRVAQMFRDFWNAVTGVFH